ncbi:hypothetical protein TSAR_007192 [Trichomalopsis sarcophagae]|uniref:Retrotransposon gag domain-containing protein n=1 Tax=Trichomalopsis sarcophagae TaxID=543379 RepID=A0A232EQV8_9HYME|nr:hypothetical protein TSAR_007192 [Trichomalopsis sarcophagae]
MIAKRLNPRATYPTKGVAPCGTWYNSDTVRPRIKNLGKTVREWSLKFSGDKGVSIEEFLEQVEENRRLDNIPDEEFLDSMVPMFEKPVLFWYRTLRSSWQTYQDIKRADLNNYSRTKRNIRIWWSKLIYAHKDQVNLVIDNMLPKLKKKMKIYRGRLTNTQELLDKAQEAEIETNRQVLMAIKFSAGIVAGQGTQSSPAQNVQKNCQKT